MEIAKLIKEYIDILIWPSFYLLIIWKFREEVRSLFKRVTKATLPGGFEIDINQSIEDTKELLPVAIQERKEKILEIQKKKSRTPKKKISALKKIHEDAGIRATPSNLDINYFRSIAKSDPMLALAGLRIEIEIMIKNLARRYHIAFNTSDSPSRIAKKLNAESKITSTQYNLVIDLLRICNAGVHGQEFNRNQIDEVLKIAKELLEDYKSWLEWGFD